MYLSSEREPTYGEGIPYIVKLFLNETFKFLIRSLKAREGQIVSHALSSRMPDLRGLFGQGSIRVSEWCNGAEELHKAYFFDPHPVLPFTDETRHLGDSETNMIGIPRSQSVKSAWFSAQ
jgi:hypothetical protein